MSLNTAHEGYEYQDLLTAYFILYWILEDTESTFLIDKKEYYDDLFDDLTIKNKKGIFKNQIKYSNRDKNHTLSKKDLSTDGSYNLAIDKLFNSWNIHPKKDSINIRLCLAWNDPKDNLLDILLEYIGNKTFKNHNTKLFKINIDNLWQKNNKINDSWKRLNEKSKDINKDEFIDFCNKLIIETNFPKSSLNIYKPDKLEKIILEQVELLGIGSFPNNNIKKEEFILHLIDLIKRARSKQEIIKTNDIFTEFQINTKYGSIEQIFPIDKDKNIPLTKNIQFFISELLNKKRVILKGEPGSGKSWFINNLIKELNKQNIYTTKHYCYIDIQDKFQKERIKIDTFYGNIISELINIYPDLKNKKKQKFASNLNELNLLIDNLEQKTVLIIDGLDHIQRIYDFRPYHDILLTEIEIIKEINKINNSENLLILIVSQPIPELEKMPNFSNYVMSPWTENDIKLLMEKHLIDNITIEKVFLSNLLLQKSSGNPLYITYLIEELKKYDIITLDILNSIPIYSYNLKEYYTYLLSKLNLKEQVALILSAVHFTLTKKELMEITGLGTFVDDSLDILKPVIKQNYSNNGYIIYHESFRRFIIEYLKSKEIIEKKLFLPLIDWFSSLNFYEHPKAYRFYLELLINGTYYTKVSEFISEDFVKNSVYGGQPWEIIKNNYHYLVKACIEIKNFEKVIVLSEINKMLTGIEDTYNESFLFYIETLGYKYGFQKISDFLIFEDKPTLALDQGLKICYLIDSNNKVAPWEYYFDFSGYTEKIDIDNFKYYLRYFLIKKDMKNLLEIINKILSDKLDDYKEILIHEFKIYKNQDFINTLIKNKEIEELFILRNKPNIKNNNLINLVDDILNIDTIIYNNQANKLIDFFDQIELFIQNKDIIQEIINRFSGKNWFFNWIIYYIKIFQVKYNLCDITSAFQYLIYDTEPFKGKPRACDLYSLKKIIFNSFEQGLSLIKNIDDWKNILNILYKVTSKTSSHYEKSETGPLITNYYFKLLIQNINKDNILIIIELLGKMYKENKNFQLHINLCEYCFYLVKAYSFINNIEQVDYYFNQGVDYLLGYTFHKDLTLEDLIESITSLNKIDNALGNTYILKIKDLVTSVVAHTDGKSTRYFPLEWFEKFYQINNKNAILYLLFELLEVRYHYIHEDSLKYILEQSNKNIDIIIESFLNQSLLLQSDDSFLMKSLKLMEKNNDFIIKNLLSTSINTRLSLKQSNKRSIDFFKIFSKYLDIFNISNDYLNDTKEKLQYSTKKYFTESDFKFFARKEFSDMSLNELSEYIKNNKIIEKDIQSLFYVFEAIKELTPEVKSIIQNLILENKDYTHEKKLNINSIFNTYSDICVYYWICCFVLQEDGWFNELSNKNAFITAYSINPGKSIDYLFELLPSKLELGYHRNISSNLFNALSDINYDSSELKKIWISLFNIISLRLPSTNEYDWKTTLSNELDMSLEELFVCLLFTRFKSYTIHKFHLVLSGIAKLLFNNSTLLIKPLKWFFINKDKFKLSIILVILELIVLYYEVNNEYVYNFESELKNMYPTNYFLIDYIIEILFDLPIRKKLELSNDLIYPILDTNEFNFFLNLNFRYKILSYNNIDMNNIFGKYKMTFFNKFNDELDLYRNNIYKQQTHNIYNSDYMLELINTDYYNLFKYISSIDNQIYYDLRIDVKTIIAQYLSLSRRPKKLKKYNEYNNINLISNEIYSENGWVRLGHIEYELFEQNHREFENYITFGAITFDKQNSYTFPFSEYQLNMDLIWEEQETNYEIDENIIFSFIQKQHQIEDYKLLWLNPSLVTKLGLRIGNFLSGLYAINNDNEVILKFNSWYCDYIATDISDEIPKLDGSELLIREDYFKKICEFFKNSPHYCIYMNP